jgi:hypothetical protein
VRRSMLLVGAVVVWSALFSGASGSEASSRGSEACAVRWRVVATGAKVPALSAVAAISSTDVWAVGGNVTGYAGGERPVVAHWDGRRLRSQRAFKPSGELTAVAAVAADDVWAVGVEGGFDGRPFVMHWDGRGWKRVATPGVRGAARLDGVAALSSGDVWAVGRDENGPLVMHWDGRAWSLVSLRGVTLGGVVRSHTSLSAVDGKSSRNVWAVGVEVTPGAPLVDAYVPIALRWDGRVWRRVRAFAYPAPSGSSWLRDIHVRSGNDVWTLGTGSGRVVTATDDVWDQVFAWDGRKQRLTYESGQASLEALAAVSPNNVWIVGGHDGHNLVMHWNGKSWRVERTPLDGLRGTNLSGVSALSATEIWAVGTHLVARYSC